MMQQETLQYHPGLNCYPAGDGAMTFSQFELIGFLLEDINWTDGLHGGYLIDQSIHQQESSHGSDNTTRHVIWAGIWSDNFKKELQQRYEAIPAIAKEGFVYPNDHVNSIIRVADELNLVKGDGYIRLYRTACDESTSRVIIGGRWTIKAENLNDFWEMVTSLMSFQSQ
jgi:hypothetical protein